MSFGLGHRIGQRNRITVLYALVEGNVGIIFRHRAQVIAPMMVIAGVGLAVRRAKKEGGTAADVLRSEATERTP